MIHLYCELQWLFAQQFGGVKFNLIYVKAGI